MTNTSSSSSSRWVRRVAPLLPVAVLVACGSADTTDATFSAPTAPGTIAPPGSFGPGTETTEPDGGTCATITKRTELAPLDVFMIVDSSLSMVANDKWKGLSNAVQSFVTDKRAEGLGIGLQYFPQFEGAYTVCDPTVYATPKIDLAPIDATQAGILVTSVQSQTPLGGTPMGPALQGALRFAQDWKRANASHKVVVLLATDGLPDDNCQFGPPGRAANSIDGAQAEAAAALAANPSVPTYVIGVGTELGALNAIAKAGGTEKAFLVDATNNLAGQLVTAFDKVRSDGLTCEYTIPPPDPGTALDFQKLNVRFVDELGYVDFLYVPKPSDCGSTDYGWYFDDPNKPTKVVLCQPFCGEVKATRVGRVDVLLGCSRREAIVR